MLIIHWQPLKDTIGKLQMNPVMQVKLYNALQAIPTYKKKILSEKKNMWLNVHVRCDKLNIMAIEIPMNYCIIANSLC